MSNNKEGFMNSFTRILTIILFFQFPTVPVYADEANGICGGLCRGQQLNDLVAKFKALPNIEWRYNDRHYNKALRTYNAFANSPELQRYAADMTALGYRIIINETIMPRFFKVGSSVLWLPAGYDSDVYQRWFEGDLQAFTPTTLSQ
jgi:hypothetical protein